VPPRPIRVKCFQSPMHKSRLPEALSSGLAFYHIGPISNRHQMPGYPVGCPINRAYKYLPSVPLESEFFCFFLIPSTGIDNSTLRHFDIIANTSTTSTTSTTLITTTEDKSDRSEISHIEYFHHDKSTDRRKCSAEMSASRKQRAFRESEEMRRGSHHFESMQSPSPAMNDLPSENHREKSLLRWASKSIPLMLLYSQI
jgi:hypothetical protein